MLIALSVVGSIAAYVFSVGLAKEVICILDEKLADFPTLRERDPEIAWLMASIWPLGLLCGIFYLIFKYPALGAARVASAGATLLRSTLSRKSKIPKARVVAR